MDDITKSESWRLVFDATIESIRRTRRTLVVLIVLVCVSIFHVYMWYASWDLARIAGRRVVMAKIEMANKARRHILDDQAHDEAMLKRLEGEISELEKKRSEATFELPLVGIEVDVNDFPIAAQIVGVAVLLWLIFNQKRLNACLQRLEGMGGWGVPKSLLELNFGLVGSRSDRFTRGLGRLLPLALPITSALFVASDLFDLYGIHLSRWQRLAFEEWEYYWRVYFRVGSDVVLGICVCFLGFWSYSEWKDTEARITRFSEQMVKSS